MIGASARIWAASSVLLLCLAAPGLRASDRVAATATVRIQGSAAVTIINTIVNNAPMQTMLLTAAIAPANGRIAPRPTARAGLASVGSPAVGGNGSSTPGAASSGGASRSSSGDAGFGSVGSNGIDGGGPSAVIVAGGSLGGPIIDGDAVSVSVADVSGGSTEDSAKVPVVIAQYN